MLSYVGVILKGIVKMFITPPLSPNLSGVARRICELCDWNVSNLRLQKMLYIAHMIYLGRTGRPLIDEQFEAWDYGPVIPHLYRKMRIYGAEPVGDRFYNASIDRDGAGDVLQEVCGKLKTFSGGKLVAISHWEKGAWANRYKVGTKNIPIPNEDILSEYRARTSQ